MTQRENRQVITARIHRYRSMIRRLQDRCAREASRWSRGTLIALVGFGCFLMLIGGLHTSDIALLAIEVLELRGIGILYGGHAEEARMWTCALLLVFSGNSLRSLGWLELRRRQLAATSEHPRCETGPRPGMTTGVLSTLMAPVMLMWSAVGLQSILNWFDEHTMRIWTRSPPIIFLDVNFDTVLDLWLGMCMTVIWLGSGIVLLWIGCRLLLRRHPASQSSVEVTRST